MLRKHMFKRILNALSRKMGIKRNLERCLTKLNYSRKIYINGLKILVPSIRGITCKASEPWLTSLLSKVFQEKHGAFIDVGVNLGQTLIKVKALDPDRRYIGFEPNPTCVFYVGELIKENKFQNCTLFPIGLFTEDCVLSLELFSDDLTDSSASLIDNIRPTNKVHSRIFVPVFRFDSIASLLNDDSIDIVKIDVEGAELEVVKSLLELMVHKKPIILIEVLPVYSDENTFRKARQEKLEQIFTDTGYAILRVEKTNANDYLGLKRVEKFGIHSDLNQCDYVIAPIEKLKSYLFCNHP